MKNSRFFILTLIIAVFSATSAFTQSSSMSGIVLDSDSLFSIPDVNIYLLDANQQQKMVYKTKTNDKGMFAFASVLKGTYQIRTVVSGYKIMISKKIEIGNDPKKYNFKLKIANIEKGEVDVANENDYNDYLDLLEDRDVINEDK